MIILIHLWHYKEFIKLDEDKQYNAFKHAVDILHGDAIKKAALEIQEKRLTDISNNDDIGYNEKNNITQYVIQLLQSLKKPGFAKAVGANRAFTTIKNPGNPNGITLNLTSKRFRNPDCKNLLNDDNGSFSKNLLTLNAKKLLSTKNIALVESGCYVGAQLKIIIGQLIKDRIYDKNGNIYKCLGASRGGYDKIIIMWIYKCWWNGLININISSYKFDKNNFASFVE